VENLSFSLFLHTIELDNQSRYDVLSPYSLLMPAYIPDSLINEIEQLKELGKFDEAIKKVNSILFRDPSNEDALLQITDIQYRK
jgi:DNA-binding SARP family transcriptional activator